MTKTDIYLLAAAALVIIGNITQIVLLRSRRLIGPRGARGIVGPAGPVGATGPQGISGDCVNNIARDGTYPDVLGKTHKKNTP